MGRKPKRGAKNEQKRKNIYNSEHLCGADIIDDRVLHRGAVRYSGVHERAAAEHTGERHGNNGTGSKYKYYSSAVASNGRCADESGNDKPVDKYNGDNNDNSTASGEQGNGQ